MSLYTQLISLVTNLTNKLNDIQSNSKSNDELPVQTYLDPNSKIRVTRAGFSETLTVAQIIESIEVGSLNQLISVGEITIIGTELTISDEVSGQINGINHIKTGDSVFDINLASTGFNRIDIIVLNTSNEVQLIEGIESDTIAVTPPIPINTLLITQINVSDATIGEPGVPILGESFIKKSFSKSTPFNGSGSDVIIPLNSNGYSNIVLTNPSLISVCGIDLSLIAGVTSAENPFEGKLFLFKNQTGNSVTFKNGFGVDFPFMIKGGSDLILPNGEYLLFSFENDYLVDIRNYVDLSKKADLVDGKVPSSQLPSYVDDVLEFANLAAFPVTGEASKIYLALDTNFSYRWSGSVYIKLSDSGKLDKVSTVTAERQFYAKKADGTFEMVNQSDIAGGGDEFFYIHMNQYVQYSQAPTTWFGRAAGPQNVGWHGTANQHTLSIGTNPLSFDAQSPSVTLPFDCQVEEAFVTIQRSNGDNRTLNLRFYAFDIVSGVTANIQSALNISTLSIWGIKSLTTDFTIPANTFSKGQRITTVTNQSSDLTGVAVSWEVLIKLKKI